MEASTSYLSGVEESVSELALKILNSSSGCWSIEGEATSGKSTALRLLRNRLSSKGLAAVYLSAPEYSLDAAPCALLSLAGQLHELEPHIFDLSAFLAPAPLDARLCFLHEAMKQQPNLVVLCDEPGHWSARSDDSDLSFSETTSKVLAFLAQNSVRQVFTGLRPEEFPPGHRPVRLRPASRSKDFLLNDSMWGPFAEQARLLYENHPPKDLDSFSPLELRLWVALWAVAPDVAVDFTDVQFDRRELWLSILRAFELHRDSGSFLGYWRSLATCRRPISDRLLDFLEERLGLSDWLKSFVRVLLLFKDGDRWFLHGTLRANTVDWMDLKDCCVAHSLLAGFYQNEAEASPVGARKLEAEAEAFYHAVEAGSNVVEERACYFVEQLNLLGRKLSRYQGKHSQASQVFKRSLAWDPANAYAHHYYAFNLDTLAGHFETIREHYAKAIELRPDHPWYHSRYINFFLAVGAAKESHRAWLFACDCLGQIHSNMKFRELHFWVLRMALHRGELAFAKEILDTIPASTLGEIVELQILRRQYEGQSIAQQHGAVVPAPCLSADWWLKGPFRLPGRLRSGHSLRSWCACRVEAIDSARIKIHLRLAQIQVGQQASPDLHLAEVTLEQLKEWHLNPDEVESGSFLEIGYFYSGDNEQVRAFVNRPPLHPLLDLQPMRPDPERYLRGAFREPQPSH